MAPSNCGSEPGRASDAQRAAWLDECIALSALCEELVRAGRQAATASGAGDAQDSAADVPAPR